MNSWWRTLTLWASSSSLPTAAAEPPPHACECTRVQTQAASPSAAPAGGCCSPRALVVVVDELPRRTCRWSTLPWGCPRRAPSPRKGRRPEPLGGAARWPKLHAVPARGSGRRRRLPPRPRARRTGGRSAPSSPSRERRGKRRKGLGFHGAALSRWS